MKIDVHYTDIMKRLAEQLPEGVFLTTQNGDDTNTMTIGWGLAGVMWGRPILCVAVRYSRHTYTILEQSNTFTVSIPKSGILKEQLQLCGSISGRDKDKFLECGFSKEQLSSQQPSSQLIIDKCDLHIECDVVHKAPMDESTVIQAIKDRFYPEEDYHMLYFGEIKSCYYTKEK